MIQVITVFIGELSSLLCLYYRAIYTEHIRWGGIFSNNFLPSPIPDQSFTTVFVHLVIMYMVRIVPYYLHESYLRSYGGICAWVISSVVHMLPCYLYRIYHGFFLNNFFLPRSKVTIEFVCKSGIQFVYFHAVYTEVRGGMFSITFYLGLKRYHDVCTWVIRATVHILTS